MFIEKDKHIGIWGFGKVGKSITHYLHTQGYQLSIMDKRIPTLQEQEDLLKKNITWYSEGEQETFFYSCDHIIPSPGINIISMRYATHIHKWLHELDLFYHEFRKPIIAVTGSIGKTSVVSILGEFFKELSIPIALGGNIGTPTFDLIAQQNMVKYALIEVSSFQLMRCTQFAPYISLWTNFYPNHLDYHATDQEYFSAKEKILLHQKDNSFSLLPLALRTKITPPPQSQLHTRNYFSPMSPSQSELAQLANNEQLFYMDAEKVIKYSKGICTTVAMLTAELFNFSFIDNILLIVAVADLLQLPLDKLQTTIKKIELPAHRIEYCGTANNIDFYNDSKATTTASTLAAVQKFHNRPLHLFLGGLSKGVDRAPFIAQLKNKVQHIYCFGQEALLLHEMCVQNKISATRYTNLENAVDACIVTVQSGDCVLLSPAGSSYDLYENYEHRGNHFKELITSYIKK
jgi:UDP-N-acetylmuramoylalanine--D-glutamate ligase